MDSQTFTAPQRARALCCCSEVSAVCVTVNKVSFVGRHATAGWPQKPLPSALPPFFPTGLHTSRTCKTRTEVIAYLSVLRNPKWSQRDNTGVNPKRVLIAELGQFILGKEGDEGWETLIVQTNGSSSANYRMIEKVWGALIVWLEVHCKELWFKFALRQWNADLGILKIPH